MCKQCYRDCIELKDIPLKGLLHLAILYLIKKKPSYGSEIHQLLREELGIEAPRPLVYTLLRRMERNGWITSEWDTKKRGPARRVYKITEEGIRRLIKVAEMIRKSMPVIESLITQIEREVSSVR